MQFLKLFLSTLIYVFFIDMLWLGVIAKNIYAQEIGSLLRMSGDSMAPNWPAAVVVYVAITLGILFFVLPKANGSYLQALGWGVLFGAITYGIYDFTNYSVLSAWSLKITLIDFVWGMVLCGLSSFFAAFMRNWFSS